MTIAAIETRYAGCRFRSRLEARWAVAFDRLGIAWEYEPQGYETSAGNYLPDFRLLNNNGRIVYVEVKGSDGQLVNDLPRMSAFVVEWAHELIVLGPVPDVRPGQYFTPFFHALNFHTRDDLSYLTTLLMDVRDRWGFGLPSAETVGLPASTECKYTHGLAPHPHLVAAYAAARSARFEHGENG